VNRSGRIKSRCAAAHNPCARLVLVRSEERHQVELFEEPPHDVAERPGSVAKLGRLIIRQLGKLGLELGVDAVRAVLDDEQRFRRQWLEFGRQRLGIGGERPLSINVDDEPFERFSFLLELRIARLRLSRDALQPPLDVIAIGNEQLEP
jgi:hypothetical protein